MSRWVSKSRRKFRPGPKILTLIEVVAMIQAGRWIYWNQKPQHPRVMENLSLMSLRSAVSRGTLRLALPNEEASLDPDFREVP